MVAFVWASSSSGYNEPFWDAEPVLEVSLHGLQVVNTNVKCIKLHAGCLRILQYVCYIAIRNFKNTYVFRIWA